MTRPFAVVPPGKAAWVSILLLGAVVPLISLGLVLALSDEVQPAQTILPHVITGIVILSVMVLLFITLRRMRVTIEDGVLIVRAAFYTRKFPLDQLDIERAEIFDLDRRSEYAPKIRLNSIALPGLQIGYYRGTPVKRKLFCLITTPRRVLLLPERVPEHYLLLSLERPQALIDALKQKSR